MAEIETINYPKLECLTRFKETIISKKQTRLLKKAIYADLWEYFCTNTYLSYNKIEGEKQRKKYQNLLAEELIENFGGLILFSPEGNVLAGYGNGNVLAVLDDGTPFAILELYRADIRYPSHPLKWVREWQEKHEIMTDMYSAYGFESQADYYEFAEKYLSNRVALDLSFGLVQVVDQGKTI